MLPPRPTPARRCLTELSRLRRPSSERLSVRGKCADDLRRYQQRNTLAGREVSGPGSILRRHAPSAWATLPSPWGSGTPDPNLASMSCSDWRRGGRSGIAMAIVHVDRRIAAIAARQDSLISCGAGRVALGLGRGAVQNRGQASGLLPARSTPASTAWGVGGEGPGASLRSASLGLRRGRDRHPPRGARSTRYPAAARRARSTSLSSDGACAALAFARTCSRSFTPPTGERLRGMLVSTPARALLEVCLRALSPITSRRRSSARRSGDS